MKTIYVLSRKEFVENCLRLSLTQEYVDSSNFAVISIENSGMGWNHFLKDGKRVLNVEFDDVDKDKDGEKVISPETAVKIFNFLDGLNQNVETTGEDLDLIVHCGAGISRSGAVGLFASELFGIKYEDFKAINMRVNHNRRVYTELLKACGRHYSNYSNLETH